MEFNARYLLNGIFAVAVIIAMFGFVYWLKNTGGFGEKEVYQVRFSVPISGLAPGADVLFNGVKVGQVDSIHLDAAQPEDLVATISIAKGTPVRGDTTAGVDYAGLTGAASILLTGGSPDAPALAADGNAYPTIVADPTASRSWTQNAGRMLGRLDNLIEKNSGRFDAILSGLARLAGGDAAEEKPPTHDLLAATGFAALEQAPDWQLTVAEPSVVLAMNTDRVLEQVGEGDTKPLGNARWADSLPNLFQARIIQSFENAGYTNVLRPADAADADYNLILDIRKFWLARGDRPAASLDFMARIMDRDGKTVAVRHFQTEAPAEGDDEAAAVAALRTAFAATASELVGWAAQSIREAGQ